MVLPSPSGRSLTACEQTVLWFLAILRSNCLCHKYSAWEFLPSFLVLARDCCSRSDRQAPPWSQMRWGIFLLNRAWKLSLRELLPLNELNKLASWGLQYGTFSPTPDVKQPLDSSLWHHPVFFEGIHAAVRGYLHSAGSWRSDFCKSYISDFCKGRRDWSWHNFAWDEPQTLGSEEDSQAFSWKAESKLVLNFDLVLRSWDLLLFVLPSKKSRM